MDKHEFKFNEVSVNPSFFSRKTYRISNITKVTVTKSFLQILFDTGNLHIETKNDSFILKNIKNPIARKRIITQDMSSIPRYIVDQYVNHCSEVQLLRDLARYVFNISYDLPLVLVDPNDTNPIVTKLKNCIILERYYLYLVISDVKEITKKIDCIPKEFDIHIQSDNLEYIEKGIIRHYELSARTVKINRDLNHDYDQYKKRKMSIIEKNKLSEQL